VAQATATSIEGMLAALSSQLGTNQLSLSPIVTRVLLRTGVSLRNPRPDQVNDAAAIAKVAAALTEMGYRV
jgi:hypothetical protein